MLEWVVIYRRHLRQSRKSRALPRLLPSNIPTCKCAVRIPDASSGPSSIPTFGFPYPLPSSVARNSFVCHSYENTGGVGVFFPFRHDFTWSEPEGHSSHSALLKCFFFKLLRTLLRYEETQPFYFQSIPNSLQKTTRGGGRRTNCWRGINSKPLSLPLYFVTSLFRPPTGNNMGSAGGLSAISSSSGYCRRSGSGTFTFEPFKMWMSCSALTTDLPWK